ncbi:MAG: vacuolar membrane-associated protein iml1 [Caeruleum heppii]|nr:MAG: vacuolar membrane-associated protein iml1 [Caeruleum heppii]
MKGRPSPASRKIGGDNVNKTLDSSETSSVSQEPPRHGLQAHLGPEETANQCEKICTLWVHNENFSKEEVILNINAFPCNTVRTGDLVEIVSLKSETSIHDFQHLNDARHGTDQIRHSRHYTGGAPETSSATGEGSNELKTTDEPFVDESVQPDPDIRKRYLFIVKDMSSEQKSKQPNLQVSLAAHIASIFGFHNRMQVVVSVVDPQQNAATHVEVNFQDQYLTRSDMWRLAVSELGKKTVYAGQKILFMGTIKAQIKNVYLHGKKIHSAYFDTRTKPVFRSESARYVIFIQMSKEMWDFDSDASGELMFSRVINGFLPELFQRWMALGVRHLVSIILFTRLVCDNPGRKDLTSSKYPTDQTVPGGRVRDYYRVVVNEMSSGEWLLILSQLKREFKIFRRDVSTHEIFRPEFDSTHPSETHKSGAHASQPSPAASAQPAAAMHGNLLEAINLAASQFSTDYIDRDLSRTGMSIVLVTAGTGLFEVEYDMLKMTTEHLISNGIGIDLVCLSKMPLHSVPLFRYKAASAVSWKSVQTRSNSPSGESTPRQTGMLYGSFSSRRSLEVSPSRRVMSEGGQLRLPAPADAGKWAYAIPHWIDISFWTPASDASLRFVEEEGTYRQIKRAARGRVVSFVPRAKMYELQMMGLMENEMTNIVIAYLHHNSFYATSNSSATPVRARVSRHRSAATGNDTPTRSTVPKSVFAKPTMNQHITKQEKYLYSWMEEYDEYVFRPLPQLRAAYLAAETRKGHVEEPKPCADESLLFGTSYNDRARSPGSIHSRREMPYLDRKMQERQMLQKSSTQKTVSTRSSKDNLGRPIRQSRQFSAGLRFLGGAPPKATASTEVFSEHARSGPALRHDIFDGRTDHQQSLEAFSGPMRPAMSSRDAPQQVGKTSDIESIRERLDGCRDDSASQPIAIKSALRNVDASHKDDRVKERVAVSDGASRDNQVSDTMDVIQAASLTKQAGPKINLSSQAPEVPLTLSPVSALAPWLTILNPSNPRKTDLNADFQYGRWQHVYPRPLRTIAMKWKSLCTPAAIPLTTEQFPTRDQLAAEYQENPYNIARNEEEENAHTEQSRSDLFKEMISLRLSQGFQLVVGPGVAVSLGQPTLGLLDVFDDRSLAEDGAMVAMSMGNHIHQLQCIEPNEIEVKRLTRKPAHPAVPPKGHELSRKSPRYVAAIQTTLARSYIARSLSLEPSVDEYSWNFADSFLAGFEESFTDQLRFWRARFLLIPVEQPMNSRRGLQVMNEDDEEEIRLEGIRKLTQMWQRHRHVPFDEAQAEGAHRLQKDTNPLNIVYQTRDSSEVIAAELDNLPLAETEVTGVRGGLFNEEEPFERSNMRLSTLAQEIQGEKGIPMRDRRWHWRFHYSCFIGSEMVTWLLENFKDVGDRDEAVELGQDLMSRGLFQHVEKRHHFRDGYYFYQIASEYRTPRPESRRGWFGTLRSDKSVPSTPLSDTAGESPRTDRSRSSSNTDDASSDSGAATPTTAGGKKLRVNLSRVMRYDVDHRKRSHRPEIINLHYDRLHNPDNCYHIRIEWVNVTAKLIEDSIVSWASTADKFGLRLVEVPIAEASSITETNPFREPYRIKPVLHPPVQAVKSQEASPISLQGTTRRPLYSKALMRRFNFVLDTEAAQNFSTDVEVTYSWGRPHYRYNQYIHRSGVLLAQVTDDGEVLLLVNKLYSNRVASLAEKHEKPDSRERRGGLERSPFASPQMRAMADVMPPGVSHSSHKLHQGNMTPRAIKEELETFCNNADELRAFYEEVKLSAVTASPRTPMLEASIPSLGLPPILRDISPSPLAGPTTSSGKNSSTPSARASVAESQ